MFSFSFSTLTSLVLILYKFSKTQNIMFSTDCLETSDPSSNLSDSFNRKETYRHRSRLVSNCFIVMTPALVVPSLGPSVSGMMLLQRKKPPSLFSLVCQDAISQISFCWFFLFAPNLSFRQNLMNSVSRKYV